VKVGKKQNEVMMETKKIKIEQLSLMAAICKEINNQQGGDLPTPPELINACIEAANMVKAKLDNFEYTPVSKPQGAQDNG
jgi:hypothetical protein